MTECKPISTPTESGIWVYISDQRMYDNLVQQEIILRA